MGVGSNVGRVSVRRRGKLPGVVFLGSALALELVLELELLLKVA